MLLTTDVIGLGHVPGLTSLYRTYSWVTELDPARLHSWELATLEHRLQLNGARLLSDGAQFSLSGPFAAIDAARAESAAAATTVTAPRRWRRRGAGDVHRPRRRRAV